MKFTKTSREDWLAKVQKDLKGRDISELSWQSGGLGLQPFYHDTGVNTHSPITKGSGPNSWDIGFQIDVKSDSATANQLALSALNQGVNALTFKFDSGFDGSNLPKLLKGIQLEWIRITFHLEGEIQEIIDALLNYSKKNDFDLAKVRLALAGNIAAKEILQIREKLPSARAIITFCERDRDAVIELSEIIISITSWYKALDMEGQLDAKNADTLAVSFRASDDFFLNIAKIRALKMLWKLVSKHLSIITDQLSIVADVDTFHENEDINYAIIKSGSQALSMAIAGVDTINIRPAKNDSHQNRIAININHLLQLESHIDEVQDPSAGSYFIEQMTDDLAQAAWAKFQRSTI